MRSETKFVGQALAVFAIALALTAEHIDKTEARAIVIAACLLTLLALERVQPTRVRKMFTRATVGLVLAALVAVKCGHEIAATLWVRTAALPEEPWQKTLERHKVAFEARYAEAHSVELSRR